MKTYYVILELGWEYNDEYYYQLYCGNERQGIPKRVYLNKREAEKELIDLNVETFIDDIYPNKEYYDFNSDAEYIMFSILEKYKTNKISKEELYKFIKENNVNTYALYEVKE